MWLGRTGFDAPRTGWHENQYGGYVHKEFTTTTIGLFVGSYSTEVLPGLHIPGRYVLWCQFGYYKVCPCIIYNSDHSCSGTSVCTWLFWQPLGGSPVAWIVQSIIALWIVGGCYRRYVDKIGSNTILLLSSIPYRWIGAMGRCHKVHEREETQINNMKLTIIAKIRETRTRFLQPTRSECSCLVPQLFDKSWYVV